MDRKKKSKISVKLYSLIVFSLTISVIMSTFSHSVYQKTLRSYQNALNCQISLNAFFSSNRKISTLFSDYVFNPTVARRDSYDGEMGYAKSQIEQLLETVSDPTLKKKIQDLQNMLFSFEEQATELISQIGFLTGSELAGELQDVLYTNSLINYTYEKHMTSLANVLSDEITVLLTAIERNYKTYVCSMAVGSILICVTGYFMISQIIKPVLQISESAVALSKQRFDIPDIQLKTHDEVAELAEAFNTMKRSVKGYISKLNEHSLLQETYLKALQTQINSHFLFNTLNVIIRTAYFEGAPQTVQLIEATTDMLRYSLNNDKKAVSIFQEISFAETYILIQKMRFTEIFSFHLIIDDDLDDIMIPSFIIQPLIENAIVHGGYHKAARCTILTAVLQLEEGILILVEDDGCGVDKAALSTIFEKRTDETGGIGLNNLKKRLQLFYHQDDMLKIYSEKDQFFRVEINIRKEQYIWNTES